MIIIFLSLPRFPAGRKLKDQPPEADYKMQNNGRDAYFYPNIHKAVFANL
jgi:hypothetical protein